MLITLNPFIITKEGPFCVFHPTCIRCLLPNNACFLPLTPFCLLSSDKDVQICTGMFSLLSPRIYCRIFHLRKQKLSIFTPQKIEKVIGSIARNTLIEYLKVTETMGCQWDGSSCPPCWFLLWDFQSVQHEGLLQLTSECQYLIYSALLRNLFLSSALH